MPTTATQTNIAHVKALLAQADLNATWAPMADLVDDVLAHCSVEDTDRVMGMWTAIGYGHHDDLILVEELLDVIVAVLPAPELAPIFARVAEVHRLRQQIVELNQELDSICGRRMRAPNTHALDGLYDRKLSRKQELERRLGTLTADEGTDEWLVAEGCYQQSAWEIYRIQTLWYAPAADLTPFDAGVMHLALSN